MNRSTWLLLSLLLSVTSYSAPGRGADIVPPEAIYKITPAHPEHHLARGQEGEATIIVTIDMFGNVKNPVIESATDDEFGLAAMLAASEWIFEPASRNGVPIEVKVKLPFKFDLQFEHRLNIELGRRVFRKIEEPIYSSSDVEISPTPKYVPAFSDFYPEHLSGSGEKASISVEFVVGPDGTVHNPRIVSNSNPDFARSAIEAISRMKYNPVHHEGRLVYVAMKRPVKMSE